MPSLMSVNEARRDEGKMLMKMAILLKIREWRVIYAEQDDGSLESLEIEIKEMWPR